jgi:Geranylgeranyl pyrophosphate synthase
MVFQIRDDVLDIVGTEDQLGKPPGQDLAEGVYTLPVLAALADKDTGPPLRSLLGRPLNQTEVNEARALVASSSALDTAIAMGHYYVDKASEAAARAPTDQLGEALDQLARSMLDTLPLTASDQQELPSHLVLSEALLEHG